MPQKKHFLAATMQGLHFKKLLGDFNENIDESVLHELKIWLKENENDCPERVNSLVERYENYLQKTMAGEHGKTAKFWVIFIYYVNTYLVLHRAMKTNNLTLFGYAVFQLSSVYFSTNHHMMLDLLLTEQVTHLEMLVLIWH